MKSLEDKSLEAIIVELKEWEARSNILYYALGTSREDEASVEYNKAWRKLKKALKAELARAERRTFEQVKSDWSVEEAGDSIATELLRIYLDEQIELSKDLEGGNHAQE